MKKNKNDQPGARSRESNAAAGDSDASESGPGASERQSRRRFAKSVAAAIVAAPVVAGVVARAQTPAATREPKAPPKAQPTPTPRAQTPPPPPSPVAKAYAEVARARFGSQVTDEEFKRIERDLEGNVRTAERLRASKLENWDEPDFVFEA